MSEMTLENLKKMNLVRSLKKWSCKEDPELSETERENILGTSIERKNLGVLSWLKADWEKVLKYTKNNTSFKENNPFANLCISQFLIIFSCFSHSLEECV